MSAPIARRALGYGTAAALVALLAAAPIVARGGGPVPLTHVIVTGASMEPALRGGDVAILRRREGYRKGDVVAYRIPAGEPGAGTLVVHRIVGRSGAHFVTKGDNQDGRDPWQPAAGDVAGEVVLRVPRLGALIAELRTPAGLAAAAAFVTFLVAAATPPARRRERDADAPELALSEVEPAAARPPSEPGSLRPAGRSSASVLLVAGAVTFALTLLAAATAARGRVP